MDTLLRNLRYTVRQIVRRPGFAFVIVFTLAVGIGPNVAIFSVLRALVLEPLPYPEPDRLVQVWESDIAGRWTQPFTIPDFEEVQAQATSFEEFGVFSPRPFNIGGGEPERVDGVMGTAGVLRVYGIQPALGRLFSDEEHESQARVAVISDALWERRFDADPAILETSMIIDGEVYQVVGIMPEGYEFISPWTHGSRIDVWTPLDNTGDRLSRGWHWLLAVARLEPGVTWRAAEAELKAIAEPLREAYPSTNARTTMWVNPFLHQVVGGMSGQLLILLGAVGLVLLTACANVASMLLARSTERRTEVAVRACLGAGRRRILAQLLTESAVLSALGGGAGILLGYWSLGMVRGLIPPDVPRSANIAMDQQVLVFSIGLSVFAGILFGLVPALTASRTDIAGTLKAGSASVAGGRKTYRALRRLAVAQLAVAFMLTCGAFLLFSSYRNVLSTPQNFDTEQVLTTEISLSGERYVEDATRTAFWKRLVEQVGGLPGVERAAMTTKLPLEGGTNFSVLVDGAPRDPAARQPLVECSYVAPGYFETMGIRLLAGRVFGDAEGTRTDRVALVNRRFVERYWPDQDPIGRQFRNNGDTVEWTSVVVGVVEDVRQWGPTQRPLAEIYFPFDLYPRVNSTLIARAQGDPLALVSAIRNEVQALDGNQPISVVRTMDQVLASAVRGRQFLLTLVSLFAVIALVLAVAGLFGIMSYGVAQRRREIGIRVAFGADRKNVLKLILREAVLLALFGVGVGLSLVVFFSVIIRSQLFGVGPLNLAYLAGGALCMLVVALLAAGMPALMASRVDPLDALRVE